MKLLIRNKIFALLSLSRFLNTLVLPSTIWSLWSLLPACHNRVWRLALPISLYLFLASLPFLSG